MADKTTTSSTCNWKLTLEKGNESVTRNISFDVENEGLMPDIKRAMQSIMPSLVGGSLSTVIQPSGWRDSDIAEDEFHCTNVEVRLVTKTETLLDV